MRIALLSYEFPPETGFGGIGTYTFYQSRALAKLGHDVHVFAGSDKPARWTYRQGGVTVTRWRQDAFLRRALEPAERHRWRWFWSRAANARNFYASLRRALASGRFDAIEAPECGAEGLLVNHLLDLPTVVRFHSPAELIMGMYPTTAMDRRLTAMAERIAISGARALSSPTRWLAEEVRSRMGVRRPIEVIPYGIDLDLFDAVSEVDVDRRFRIPANRLLVLFAGRLERRKGIHLIREILPEVLRRNDRVSFLLAGEDEGGYSEAEVIPFLREEKLLHAVHFLGRVESKAVRALMKRADILLLTSLWENLPYACLEAMAAGKPIVASDCGGIPELLRHEVDGLLAATGNPSSYVDHLHRLLSDEALRRRLGESARRRVEERFTDLEVARRSLLFYEHALGAPSPRRSATAPAEGVLGPDTWFEAWWMRRGAEPTGPRLEPQGGESPLTQIPLPSLGFVRAVLSRAYFDRFPGGASPETRFLEDLEDLLLEKARATRADPTPLPANAELRLPPWGHPVLGDEATTGFLLAEFWRLTEDSAALRWLGEIVGAEGFVEAARHRFSLRWLAMLAARWKPGPTVDAALRSLYFDAPMRERILREDRARLDDPALARDLLPLVEGLGLHVPLERPRPVSPSPAPAKRGPKGKGGAAVTVLIPAYRHEAFVREAIDSVLAQTRADLKVLLVDDRSPDATVDKARAVEDPRVEVRVNEERLGLGNSVLASLPAVRTPFVALLNSDDLYYPSRLERCLESLEGRTDAAVVATDLTLIDGEGGELTPATASAVRDGRKTAGWVRWYEGVRRRAAGSEEMLEPLLRHNFLATSSNILARTEWLRSHADRLRGLKYCFDWQVFLDAAAEGSLLHLREPLLAYRLHSGNTVWFEREEDWRFLVETNRVLASALSRRAAEGEEARALERAAALLAGPIAEHGEADGALLALAGLAAGRALEDSEDSGMREGLRLLATRAAEGRRALARLRESGLDPARLAAVADRDARAGALFHVAEVLEGRTDRHRREGAALGARAIDAERKAEDAEARSARSEEERRKLWEGILERDAYRNELERSQAELLRFLDEARERAAATSADLEGRLAEITRLYEEMKARAQAAEEEGRTRLQAAEEESDSRAKAAAREIESLRGRLEELEKEKRKREEVATKEVDDLRVTLETREREEEERVQAAVKEMHALRGRMEEIDRERQRHVQELAHVQREREHLERERGALLGTDVWFGGDLLVNRLRLGPVVRWLRGRRASRNNGPQEGR